MPQNDPGSAVQQSQKDAFEEEPEEVVQEGESRNLLSRVSEGRWISARYQLTNKMLYFSEGIISTTSEQVPLWAVRDIDVKQDWLQKARSVGTVIVHVEHSDYTGRATVELEDMEHPLDIQRLLNEHSRRERLSYDRRQRTHYYGGR